MKKQKYGKQSALVSPKVSADQLRAKTGRTMVDGAAAGHRKFLHAWGSEGKGKIIPAQVLSVLQGGGPVRQRSLSADLIFWLLLYQDKSNSPSAATERTNVIGYQIALDYPFAAALRCNSILSKRLCLVGDCFVPRNDGWVMRLGKSADI